MAHASPRKHPLAARKWARPLLIHAVCSDRIPFVRTRGCRLREARFCPRWPWPLTLILKLRRSCCAIHLTAKFHHPTFNLRKLACWQRTWQTNYTSCADFPTSVTVWRHACCEVIMPTISFVAAWCVGPTVHALQCIVNGDDSTFLIPGDLDLWPWHSNSGDIFVQST